MNYELSIVIPVKDRASLVGATLESIYAQDTTGFDLILVDNGSSDNTLEVLTEWKGRFESRGIRCEVLECRRPLASSARNEGLAHVATPYVMFFDSDDIMPSDHVSMVIKGLEAHPEAEIIGWDVSIFADGKLDRVCRFEDKDMAWNNLFHGIMAPQRWCAQTSLVRSVGGWNEKIGPWDDIELGARLLAVSPKVVRIGKSGVEIRAHGASMTGSLDANPERMEPALTSIESTLGRRGKRWCNLKRAIQYGVSERLGVKGIEKLVRKSRFSFLDRLAYRYTAAGMRGAAELLKIFYR